MFRLFKSSQLSTVSLPRFFRTSSFQASRASSNTLDPMATLDTLDDQEVIALIDAGKVSVHRLEEHVKSDRAVEIRRKFTKRSLLGEGRDATVLDSLPFRSFNVQSFYDQILGANCEAVIGYVPVPVGVVGPLLLDGEMVRVPMATTEGALIASTNRGCRAIFEAGGVHSNILANGMTRAPLLRAQSVREAAAMKAWIETPANSLRIKEVFNKTSRFAQLNKVRVQIAGRNVFVRFSCQCGDAMGMNMVSKGSLAALDVVTNAFPNAEILSLSGNYCSDKKPSAVNWIDGRGRSVACEVHLPADIVEKVLKTNVDKIIEVNTNKNYIGSAMAGSLGGFNAHASNIVSAIFLATGNDIAQNVESSTCITILEKDGDDLHMSVTMPSIEVGTVGGGTGLLAQKACLEMIGCAGASQQPGFNADKLARVVAGTVLAGELSLLSALSSNQLVSSHLKLNRKKTPSISTVGLPPTHEVASSHDSHLPFGDPSSGGPSTPLTKTVTSQPSKPHDGVRHLTTFTRSSVVLYGDESDSPCLPVP